MSWIVIPKKDKTLVVNTQHIVSVSCYGDKKTGSAVYHLSNGDVVEHSIHESSTSEMASIAWNVLQVVERPNPQKEAQLQREIAEYRAQYAADQARKS